MYEGRIWKTLWWNANGLHEVMYTRSIPCRALSMQCGRSTNWPMMPWCCVNVNDSKWVRKLRRTTQCLVFKCYNYFHDLVSTVWCHNSEGWIKKNVRYFSFSQQLGFLREDNLIRFTFEVSKILSLSQIVLRINTKYGHRESPASEFLFTYQCINSYWRFSKRSRPLFLFFTLGKVIPAQSGLCKQGAPKISCTGDNENT